MMRKFSKFVLYFLVFVGFVFLVILTFSHIQEQKVGRRIAAQFQITPSWASIQDHLLFKEFKPGMSIEEVHRILDKVGPWEIRWREDPKKDKGSWDSASNQFVFGEIIRFTENATIKLETLGSWSFLYDKNGFLVEQHRLDSGG